MMLLEVCVLFFSECSLFLFIEVISAGQALVCLRFTETDIVLSYKQVPVEALAYLRLQCCFAFLDVQPMHFTDVKICCQVSF